MLNDPCDVFAEIDTWEIPAINELLGQNTDNVSQRIKRIIVYGATQSGKTTMLMNLLGIKNDQKDRLGELLRGNAAQGNSSTSTPIIYNRSNSNKFYISEGDAVLEYAETKKEYTEDGFRKAVAEINDSHRQHKTTSFKVRYYYIPDEYFEGQVFDSPVQIMDLPGFGERNDNMSSNIDILIKDLSAMVAGAIVVVRGEKITNLKQEYKSFIENHHTNHLAIAVTHALSVDSELKRRINSKTFEFENANTDEELADGITKYIYQKIIDDEYLSSEKFSDESAIFPIEKTEWLEENCPELVGAFKLIYFRLLQRVDSMKNTTSINACIEQLQIRCELMDGIIAEEKKEYPRIEEHIQNLSKKIEDIKKDIDKLSKEYEKINKKKAEYIERYQNVLGKIINKNKGSFTPSYACFHSGWFNTCKLNANAFIGELAASFEDLKCIDTELCAHFSETILKAVNGRDCSYLLKWHRRSTVEYGIYSIAKNIRNDLCKKDDGYLCQVLEQNKNEIVEEIDEKLYRLARKISALNSSDAIYGRNVNILKDELNKCKNNIETAILLKEDYERKKNNATEFFVKHYYLKEKELYDRIEQTKDAVEKTILFVTLSAINFGMKPYLEGENNG